MKKLEKNSKCLLVNMSLGIAMMTMLGLYACNSASSVYAKRLQDSLVKDSIKAVNRYTASQPESSEIAKDIKLNTNTPKDKKLIKTAEVKFRVNNVLRTTEKIEDMTARYGGYVTYSNLTNSQQNCIWNKISKDSIQMSKQIMVANNITLRVPNENLDSLVRGLNQFVVFLDYRGFKLDDVTFQYVSNQKKSGTLQKYQQRQTKHIDTKGTKLKETSNAEETVLNSQLESEELSICNLTLEDQLKYCTLTIYIYQNPVIVREIIPNFDKETSYKPNIFKRLLDSVIQGWWILEEIIIFLVRIWGILLLIGAGIMGYRMVFKK